MTATLSPVSDGGIEDFLDALLDHAEGVAAQHDPPAEAFAPGPVRLSLLVVGATYRRRLTGAIDHARASAPAALRCIALDGQAGAGEPPGWHFPVTRSSHLERLHQRPALVYKLDEASLTALPAWQAAVANPRRLPDQKARIHLARSRPDALAQQGLALRAVLLPRVTGAARSAIAPADAADALRALAPSTMFLLRGRQRAIMQKITILLRSVSAFRLDLGRDSQEAADAIAGFLARA